MPAQKIQLVLQGGGARLFALIAALEEIHAASDLVKVARVAGTSAGAIVGGLYAAGITPAVMRAALGQWDLRELTELQTTGLYTLLWRIYRNRALARDEPLLQLIGQLLRNQGKPDLKLGDVDIPLLIVAADVSDRRAVVYDSEGDSRDRSLVRCVLDSSALPFVFRTARPDQQSLVLDGGLVENLPVEPLKAGIDRFGPIVAVSFREDSRPTPRTPAELARSLLETAIGASVEKAKALGNIYLVELDTDGVGLLDFTRAQRILRGEERSPYDNARRQTAETLHEIRDAHGRLVSKARWDKIDPATSGQLIEIYKAQQNDRHFKQYVRRLSVIANSLLAEGEEDHGSRDVVVQHMEFATAAVPIDCLMARIFVDPGQRPSNFYVKIWSSDGNSVPFSAIPLAARSSDGLEIYAVQISFTPPLPAEGEARYTLRTEFRIGRALFGSGDAGEDHLLSTITRAEGVADSVELEAHIPESFGLVEVRSDGPIGCTAVANGEAEERRRKGHLRPYVWRAEQVPNGSLVQIILRR